MKQSEITVLSFPPPPVCKSEILRYAGAGGGNTEFAVLTDDCLAEALPELTYRVCFREYPILRDGEMLDLGFCRTASRDLQKNLVSCDRVIVFAATVGLGIDRLILRYSRISPARELILHAIGNERVESLCDAFTAWLDDRSACRMTPRFSPGYGDLPLALQKEIFAALDCPAQIGLTLGETLLMTPCKSVTAVIGLDTKETLI